MSVPPGTLSLMAAITSQPAAGSSAQSLSNFFLAYSSLKYTLESFHDYTPSSNVAADPNCANVTAAKGVNLKDVQAAYPQLF